MTIIGITGPSGAGKSTALRVLAEMGACTIDCDAVYHNLLESAGPMLEALYKRFPGAIKAGKINRKLLGKIVFSDEKALLELNTITHSHVGQEVQRQLAQLKESGESLVAMEAIALIESGLASLCTDLVGILAPTETRAARIMAREGIPFDYAMARIKSQKPDSFFREHCDYIVENQRSDVQNFTKACHELFLQIISKYA